MKKLILCSFLLALSYSAIGQSSSGWYDAYQENNIYTNYYYLQQGVTDLFPDSTVKTGGYDQYGNTVPISVYVHGIGEIFDPKSKMYLSPCGMLNPYTVDTVSLIYGYHYVSEQGAAPDTLIFQFYTGTGIDTGFISANPSTGFPYEMLAYTKYDYHQNLGAGAINEVKVLLGSGYGTSGSPMAIHVATNGAAGISVKPGGLFAYTVSYRPGFKYKTGDTIDEAFYPKNAHSRFYVYSAFTDQKLGVTDYEEALTVVTPTRYNQLPSWDGRYIPGTAWNSDNIYTWSEFYTVIRTITNDAGIRKFDSPDNFNSYCANTSTPVNITLANDQGSANLNSATISWALNGK